MSKNITKWLDVVYKALFAILTVIVLSFRVISCPFLSYQGFNKMVLMRHFDLFSNNVIWNFD